VEARRMARSLVLLVALLCSSCHTLEDSDGIFTSNVDLQRLLKTEAEIVRELHSYIKEEEIRIDKLKKYVREYDRHHSAALVDVEAYVSNPLNSYLLIKRLTTDWKGMVRDLMTPKKDIVNEMANRTVSDTLKWPNDEDLNGAAVALTRLQDTYGLRPGDISQGVLSGVKFGTTLTANDCFELGRQSYNNGDHPHTVQWMEEALEKVEIEGDNPSVKKEDIYEYLGFSYYSEGDYKKALRYTDLLLELDPDHPRAAGNKAYYVEYLDSANTVNKKGDDGTLADDQEIPIKVKEEPVATKTTWQIEHEQYLRLCRGDVERSPKVLAKLKCYLNFGEDPYLKLMPYKEEVVNLKPRISIFYDVLTENEIQTVKELATPRFKRATVQNYKSGELETASYRISKTAWLKRAEDSNIERIYQRVGDVTGLSMTTSEELQVSNYGMGGHYEPHFDFARREESKAFASLGTGNRIATWLFYVSDVDLGGATVFPSLDLTLWPKKGSAAFWYNLHRNGEGDVLTRHAACPVLAGTKWVSNFWIHEFDQEFRRPCSLSPFE